MRSREIRVSADVEFALSVMGWEDRPRWAGVIERLARRGTVRGARRIAGSRDLFRLAGWGWLLVYRQAGRGGRITLASLARRRPESIVDTLLERGDREVDDFGGPG